VDTGGGASQADREAEAAERSGAERAALEKRRLQNDAAIQRTQAGEGVHSTICQRHALYAMLCPCPELETLHWTSGST
jgi:hypothetical protein